MLYKGRTNYFAVYIKRKDNIDQYKLLKRTPNHLHLYPLEKHAIKLDIHLSGLIVATTAHASRVQATIFVPFKLKCIHFYLRFDQYN